MLVKNFNIAGPLLVTCKTLGDERGFFCERYRQDFFNEIGLSSPFVQENFSRSQTNVLRGLHYQFDRPQGKLVTCMRGLILDVAVDIRQSSPTFGQSLAVELDGHRPQWFWIPPGFAHGFLVKSKDGADLLYKVTEYYNPKGEAGIHWADSAFKIDWSCENPVLSEKDRIQPSFEDYKKNPYF